MRGGGGVWARGDAVETSTDYQTIVRTRHPSGRRATCRALRASHGGPHESYAFARRASQIFSTGTRPGRQTAAMAQLFIFTDERPNSAGPPAGPVSTINTRGDATLSPTRPHMHAKRAFTSALASAPDTQR